MNIKEYENYCADFFNNEKFLPENLKVTYKNLSFEEFYTYHHNIICKYYDEKDDIIIGMVKEIRATAINCIDPMALQSNQEILRPYRDIINSTITNKYLNIDCVRQKILKFNFMVEQHGYERSLLNL